MKKFKKTNQSEFEELNDSNLYKPKDNEHTNTEGLQSNIEETSYKKLEEKEEKDDYIDPSMKLFRKIIGVLLIGMFILNIFKYTSKTAFKENLTSGYIENIVVGDLLSKEALKLEPMDTSIEVSSGFGNLEISIWNFAEKEDNDYVQVYIDGVAEGAPFSIRHKPVKISVPDKAVIQVQGIRDGSNNGITYAVFFNKTGDTYLNTVPLNATNSYTIISK